MLKSKYNFPRLCFLHISAYQEKLRVDNFFFAPITMAFEGVKFMIEKCHVIDHLELAGIFSIQMCKIMDSLEKDQLIELFYEKYLHQEYDINIPCRIILKDASLSIFYHVNSFIFQHLAIFSHFLMFLIFKAHLPLYFRSAFGIESKVRQAKQNYHLSPPNLKAQSKISQIMLGKP